MLESTEQLTHQAASIEAVFHKQKEHALKLRTSTVEERLSKLKKLKQAVLDNQEKMCEAAWADFRKTPAEVELPKFSQCFHRLIMPFPTCASG